MSLKQSVLRFRDRRCAACPSPCALRDAHAAPCDQCPLGEWGVWDCEEEGVLPAPAAVVSPASMRRVERPSGSALWRVLRGWRRAGIRLVGKAERHAQLAQCRPCEYVRRDERTGLVSCGAGCNCGAAAVSIHRRDARCKLAKWATPSP